MHRRGTSNFGPEEFLHGSTPDAVGASDLHAEDEPCAGDADGDDMFDEQDNCWSTSCVGPGGKPVYDEGEGSAAETEHEGDTALLEQDELTAGAPAADVSSEDEQPGDLSSEQLVKFFETLSLKTAVKPLTLAMLRDTDADIEIRVECAAKGNMSLRGGMSSTKQKGWAPVSCQQLLDSGLVPPRPGVRLCKQFPKSGLPQLRGHYPVSSPLQQGSKQATGSTALTIVCKWLQEQHTAYLMGDEAD